jgi:non-heme chloroperoxidase
MHAYTPAPSTTDPTDSESMDTDTDMKEQAKPGHGIPSQDPDPAAQISLSPEEAARETHSVMVGGGAVAGAATGAAVGVAMGGPVGVVVGATLGAVAGALGGSVAGATDGTDEASDAGITPVVDAATVYLHIEDSNDGGRPVVLIHGWPLTVRAWDAQVAALRTAGYRVVAYDRRGFGQSDRPSTGYSYDTLADDLQRVLEEHNLQDVTLVGFSMGGGEVARYVGRHGEARLHSVVFAASVTPYLLQTASNPHGPLTPEAAAQKKQACTQDRHAYFEAFTTAFYSADGVLKVSPAQRDAAMAMCEQSAQHAALACMESFATTDFRDDLERITRPTLVIHGSADAIVPLDGAGLRTHRAIAHSQLVQIGGAPHGMNVSHANAFNDALLSFLPI